METGIWTTYLNGVYDITDFIRQHPGGSANIMIAAGRALDPIFTKYRLHYESKSQNYLERFKIGELSSGEAIAYDETLPWAREMVKNRTTIGIIVQQIPFNCETHPSIVAKYFLTPIQEAYVRCHNKVPIINES